MNDAADNSDASPAIPTPDIATTPVAKKSRGRPKAVAPETPQQRIDRLQVELAQAHEAKKIAEQQRDSIVGKVVVAHALANPDYRKQLAELLRREVTGKGDLAVIAELLT